MTALWIILGIIALIIILFTIHIKVRIAFSYSEDENNAEIELRYLFFKLKLMPKDKEKSPEKAKKAKKTDKKKAEKEPKKKGELLEDFKFFIKIYDDLKDLLGKFLTYFLTKALKIYSLNISAEIGFEEALQTGIAIGAANAAVYGIIASMQRNMRLYDYNVNIYGNFEEKRLKLGVDCILGTNIMRVLILLLIITGGAVKILSKWKKP